MSAVLWNRGVGPRDGIIALISLILLLKFEVPLPDLGDVNIWFCLS
jgi:hypothetical protein